MAVVPVFVSSTFRDFHGERDALRTVVAPALNRLLAPLAARVELLDLRWGVDTTTEADEVRAQQQVLDVCVSEIDRCRPLFLGLLGDRFGWLPPAGLLPRSPAPVPLSVTGLEFWHGVLAPDADCEAVIGIRRLARGAPQDWRDPEQSGIKWLRASVAAAERRTRRVKTFGYQATVEMSGGRVRIRAVDLDRFAATVTELLGPLVLARARALEAAARTPYEAAAALSLEARGVIVGRDRELSEIRQALQTSGVQGVVLVGPSGMGKTTVWKAACEEAETRGYRVHRVIVGAGPGSTSTVDVVRRLADGIGIAVPDLASSGYSQEGAIPISERAMQWWADVLAGVREPTLLAVDGLDRLDPGTARDTVEVVRRTVAASPIRYLASTSLSEQAQTLVMRGMTAIEIADLPPAAARSASIEWALAEGRRQLPGPVLGVFASRPRSGLWLRLAVGELSGIDASSFALAEDAAAAGSDPAQALARMLLGEAQALPDDDTQLANLVLDRVGAQLGGGDSSALLFGALGLARSGMAPADLQGFAGVTNTLRFTRARWLLGGQIVARDDTGRLAFDHQLLREAALDRYRSTSGDRTLRRLHAMLAAYLGGESGPASAADPVAAADRLWHALLSGDSRSVGEALRHASGRGISAHQAGSLVAESVIQGRRGPDSAPLEAIRGLASSDDGALAAWVVRTLLACDDVHGEADLRLVERQVVTSAGVRLARRLLAERDGAESLLLLSRALNQAARVELAGGAAPGLDMAEESLATARRLMAADPASHESARQLRAALSSAASIASAHGKTDAAWALSAEALSLARRAAAVDPSADAHRRLIRALLDFGRIKSDKVESLAAYEEAAALARRLSAENPADLLAVRDVIDALTWVGIARMGRSDFAGSQEANAEAIVLSRRVLERDPSDQRVKRQLAGSLHVQGLASLARWQRDAAERALAESLQLRRDIAAVDPTNLNDAVELQYALWAMGRTMQARFRFAQGKRLLDEGRRIGERAARPLLADQRAAGAAEAEPASSVLQMRIASLVVSSDFGAMLRALERRAAGSWAAAYGFPRGALETAAVVPDPDSLAVARRAAAANPEDAEAARALWRLLDRVGTARMAAGGDQRAFRATNDVLKEALKIARRLAKAHPASVEDARRLAASLANIGVLTADAPGRRRRGRSALAEALAIRRRLASADPANTDLSRELAGSLNDFAVLATDPDDLVGRSAAHAEALEVRLRVAASGDADQGAARHVALSLMNLGSVALERGDTDAAAEAFTAALEIRRLLAAAEPGAFQSIEEHVLAASNLCRAELEGGNLVPASIAIQEALLVARRLAAADPSDAGAARLVWVALTYVGGVADALGDHATSHDAHSEALDIARRLAAADPRNRQAAEDLAQSLRNLEEVGASP